MDGCFLGPFRGKDLTAEASSFVAAGPAPLKPWLHVADRSWSPGRTEVGGPKTGSLSRSETIPTCKATIMFEPYPNSCTVLEGR